VSLEQRNKRISMCLDIEGFMKQTKFPRGYKDMFTDNGRTLTPEEARSFLFDELKKGRSVIPLSRECGNPCQHAANGCTGFDYNGGGCTGRYIDQEAKSE
jgi:hypothetical protein